VSTVPAGLDLDRVTAYLETHTDLRGPFEASLLAGGRSNLTYALTDGARRWVLRRPPLGHVLASAHDMDREYRVMEALGASAVPVPRMVVRCTDVEVTGTEFYVMEFVDGVIVRDAEQLEAWSDVEATAVADGLVETLLALHAVDPQEVGLGDLGRPVGYAERQVRTWTRQLAASRSRDLPEVESLARRLAVDVPVNPRHAIVHGDYRLDNAVLGPDHRVAAVLDWEMATLGDPLTDLASLVVWWDGLAGLDSPVAAVPGDHVSVPSDRMVSSYAAAAGIDPDGLRWYVAFAYFKLAAIFEGIHYRDLAGQTVGEGFDRIGALVGPVTEAGHRALDGDVDEEH
jgi:aminoglycoside phosphotransferase (APT) family kinase protein